MGIQENDNLETQADLSEEETLAPFFFTQISIAAVPPARRMRKGPVGPIPIRSAHRGSA